MIAPDAATRHGRRWVVLPLSTEPGLAASPIAYRLDPTQANGLEITSFVMAWQPTTVLAEALQGPIGRLAAADVAAIAARVIAALELTPHHPCSRWFRRPRSCHGCGADWF